MWWYRPYWYRTAWRYSLTRGFVQYSIAMLIVALIVIAVMWPLSLWGHALHITPNFAQLTERSRLWTHQHYPLVGLRYLGALIALAAVVLLGLGVITDSGPGRHRLFKLLQAAGLALVILPVAVPAGSSQDTVPNDLVDKTLTAATSELNGLAIHYREVGNPATPAGLVDASGPTVCQTQPTAGRPAAGPVTLIVKFSCATSRSTVPRDLVGKELDVAEAELRTLHIKYHEIDASHSAFGILEPSNWTVCHTYPPAGEAPTAPVQLFAQEAGC
jgi:hypothetical protein